MRTNISAVKLYLECPAKWWGTYVCMRGAESSSEALTYGNEWHEICEKMDPRAIRASVAGAVGLRRMRWGFRHYTRWLREWDVELLHTELPLSMPLGAHELFGQLDAVVKWNGQFWHLQHKTCAAATDAGVFTRTQARSFHEVAYAAMAEAAGFTPWGGSIIAMLRKLGPAQMRGHKRRSSARRPGENRRPPFEAHVVAVANRDRAMEDIENTVSGMAAWNRVDPPRFMDERKIPQNPYACDSFFHNSLCPYIDVCDGVRSITTFPTINPLERYGDAE